MVEIKNIEDRIEWNNLLLKSKSFDIFSSYEWGEYKKINCWKVERLAFYKGGNYLGQCQLIFKKKFNFLVGWTNSGINYTSFKNLKLIINKLKEYFRQNRYFYQRFSFFEKLESCKSFELFQLLKQSEKRINSNFTIIHKLDKDMNFLEKMSSNHRYYYKKALGNNLIFKMEKNIDKFSVLHNQMVLNKDLNKIVLPFNRLKALYECFNDNIKIFTVEQNKNMVAGCVILFWKQQAYYYFAASNKKGREVFASYLMVKELLDYLVTIDVVSFDFMGITPFDENAYGVNKFKIGFGGEIVERLGEWEISNSKILSFLVNKVYL